MNHHGMLENRFNVFYVTFTSTLNTTQNYNSK